MSKRLLFYIVFLNLLFTLSSSGYAGGLTTTFGEVKVENLKIGKQYSLEETAEFPLIVQNTSDQEIELKVEVLYPKEKELKKDFAPIPDTSWISLEKDHFILAPGEEAKTDVIINIPDDKEYQGRKYQVYLWSHTIGRSLGVGLKSRLLFTVSPEQPIDKELDDEVSKD